MRRSLLIVVLLLICCQSRTPPQSKPDVVEQSPFNGWPTVTDKPILVGTFLWGKCQSLTPEEAKTADEVAKLHGPHAKHSIIVRVNSEGIAAFREGSRLPTGAIVVKEKYLGDPVAPGLYGYAAMTKREAGYYPEGGDWEYEYVSLIPE